MREGTRKGGTRREGSIWGVNNYFKKKRKEKKERKEKKKPMQFPWNCPDKEG
jgi:hypothetical protein